MKFYKIFILLSFIYNLSLNIDDCICQWQQTAGPQGSNIISFFSTGKKTIFAGSYGEGVFRSTNLGAKWQLVNTGLPDGFDYAFTSNGSYLFVGTQNGVYRSSSSGNSWEPANTGIEIFTVFALTIKNVSGTNYVFAGTSEGVFKSSDNGNSWTPTGLNLWTNALTFKTQNGISLFAVASSDYGVFNYDVFRSDDYGASWLNVFNGLPASMVINDIIATGQNIFIGTNGNGVFVSTNNGANWSSDNTGLPVASDFDVKTFTYFNNSIYAGTSNGIYKSNNLGTNWFAVNSGFMDSYVNKIYSFAYNFFAGTQSAIYASFNEGKKWEPVIDGLPYIGVTCLAAKKNKLFAGTELSGVSYSDDNADIWYQINKGGDKNIIGLGIKGNIIFKETKSGLYRSSNNGKEWSHTNYNGSKYDQSSKFVSNSSYTFAAIYYQHKRVISGSILRSSDEGLTWNEVLGGPIVSVAVNNSNIFACRPNIRAFIGKIFKSTNNGNDWTTILEGDNYSSLALKGTTIFTGTYENGILRSTDNGDTWKQFNNGLTDTSIIALIYTTNENRIFAVTPSEIFYTTINGTKWYSTHFGYTSTEVISLATDNDFIYVGFSNMGVWRYSLAKMSGPVFVLTNETPLAFSLSQNYPNPFNPVTKIRFEIPLINPPLAKGGRGGVSLKIYNILGKEVATLVNENLNAGAYEVDWNASQYPSGVYFYQIQACEFTDTKRMILIK